MRIKVTQYVDIDIEQWAICYDVPATAKAVRADVQQHCEDWLQQWADEQRLSPQDKEVTL